MANPEHVAVVKKGAAAIEAWRQKYPRQVLDLSEANLREVDLSRADLSNANLCKARLYGAVFHGANLRGANLSMVAAPFVALTMSDLSGAILSGADLFEANFSGAQLFETDFSGANLSYATFMFAKLFSTTDFSDTILIGTRFLSLPMPDVNFTGARMGSTIIADCALAHCVGLETVEHDGPSNVDFDTLRASFRASGNRLTPKLETFFLGAGIPKELLDELPRILAEVKYCTCFICHGSPDQTFAEKLVKGLKIRGVSCWLYPMDYTPGRKVWGEIIERRREAEKMIVLCSAESLIRDGVLKEIEEQKDEEPDKIVPISLDNVWRQSGFVVKRGQRDLKPFLLERNYADFADESKYEASLNRLLKGIKREGK